MSGSRPGPRGSLRDSLRAEFRCSRPSATARRASAAVLLAALAAAAFAGTATAAVSLPRSIAVFYHRDFVTLTGFKVGDVITTDVLRNGVVIGSVTETAVNDPATGPGGSLVINHPGGVCWTGHTPDLQPGDVVRTSVAGGAVDSTAVANVDVTKRAFLAANGDIVVKGFACDAAGGPLPLGQIGQRLVANKQAFEANGKRTLRAPGDGTLDYDPIGPANPTGTQWTAVYTGLSAADQPMAVGAESRLLWNGPNPGLFNPAGFPSEMTFAEVGGPAPATPGPSANCAGSPLARAAVTSVDAAHTVNGAAAVNLANGGGALTVSGVSQDASAAAATLTDGTRTITAPTAAPTPAAGTQTWSASFTAADVATLADGALIAAATYTTVGGPITGATLRVIKDTVAPPAPGVGPGPGTYPTSQSVSLTDNDGSAAIRWTNDGSAPTATSALYTTPLSVTATQTIKALAIDPAGNPSTIATFAYVISPPPTSGGTTPPSQRPSDNLPGPVVAGPVVAGTASSPEPALRSLVVDRTISRRVLRVHGLRLSMLLRDAPIVRVAIYRIVGGHRARSPVLLALRVSPRAGTYVLRLNGPALLRALRSGSYEIAVAPGESRGHLGAPTRVRFRVTR